MGRLTLAWEPEVSEDDCTNKKQIKAASDLHKLAGI
jgi:hypothetical protein